MPHVFNTNTTASRRDRARLLHSILAVLDRLVELPVAQPREDLLRPKRLHQICWSHAQRPLFGIRERRWVLLKIPRCDIDGVGEGK